MKPTLEQMISTRKEGRNGWFYLGGQLFINRLTCNEHEASVTIGNGWHCGTVFQCEQRLFDDIASDWEWEDSFLTAFDPEIALAGLGTMEGMCALLLDYCEIHRLEPRSSDEMALDESIAETHRAWFRQFSVVWEDVEEHTSIGTDVRIPPHGGFNLFGMNAMSAAWGAEVIASYLRKNGSDPEYALGDILGDLMHYAHDRGLDFTAELNRACEYFAAETSKNG